LWNKIEKGLELQGTFVEDYINNLVKEKLTLLDKEAYS